MAGGARGYFLARHPQRPHDAVVERPVGVQATESACESEPQISNARRCDDVVIDAHHRLGYEFLRGFLERLATHSREERLTGVEVASRLVEPQALSGLFFDQEEAAVAFNNGGDGDAGCPDVVVTHTAILTARRSGRDGWRT